MREDVWKEAEESYKGIWGRWREVCEAGWWQFFIESCLQLKKLNFVKLWLSCGDKTYCFYIFVLFYLYCVYRSFYQLLLIILQSVLYSYWMLEEKSEERGFSMDFIEVVKSVRFGLLRIVFLWWVVVMASSRLKSGSALVLHLGRRLYFAVFLGLYSTTLGGDLGGIGGLSMGGVRRIYGLSPTSVVRFEKSADDDVRSFVSSVWFSVTFCFVFSSFVLFTFCVVACWLVLALSSICLPKSFSQDTAYHSLCDTLTSGSGISSLDRTATSGIRCSGM